jgi:hypothetical protein
MQVMNTTNGPVTIAGLYTIQPGSLRMFDAELWAELRARKAVAFWLERGDLKEIGTAGFDVGPPIDIESEPMVPALIIADPLDHDGDGRKGGSKPRKAKR